jgi:hypothetical protein
MMAFLRRMVKDVLLKPSGISLFSHIANARTYRKFYKTVQETVERRIGKNCFENDFLKQADKYGFYARQKTFAKF